MAVPAAIEVLRPQRSLPNFGVVDAMFYNYAGFVEEFQNGFPVDKNLYVNNTTFKNREAWLKVVLGHKGREADLAVSPRARAIVPFWLSTQITHAT